MIKTRSVVDFFELCMYCFFVFFSMIYTGCHSTQRESEEGMLLGKRRMFNTSQKSFVPIKGINDSKMWFRDSFVIVEMWRQDNYFQDGVEVSSSVSIDRYIFGDLRKRNFYVYHNFSDTAKPVTAYRPSANGLVEGGLKFFMRDTILDTPLRYFLPDTVINGQAFKRITSIKNQQSDGVGSSNIKTGYYRCNAGNGPFRIDNPTSELLGCPILRLETSDGNNRISYEIEPIANKLTSLERKVFDAWIKNAKHHSFKK